TPSNTPTDTATSTATSTPTDMPTDTPTPTSTPPSNDNFSAAQALNQTDSASGNTIGATTQTGEPLANCAEDVGKTVWFAVTPSADGQLRLTSSSSSFDTVLAVYSGSSVDALTMLGCNDDASENSTDSALTVSVTAGQTYAIQLADYDGVGGDYSLTLLWSLPPTATPTDTPTA